MYISVTRGMYDAIDVHWYWQDCTLHTCQGLRLQNVEQRWIADSLRTLIDKLPGSNRRRSDGRLITLGRDELFTYDEEG